MKWKNKTNKSKYWFKNQQNKQISRTQNKNNQETLTSERKAIFFLIGLLYTKLWQTTLFHSSKRCISVFIINTQTKNKR